MYEPNKTILYYSDVFISNKDLNLQQWVLHGASVMSVIYDDTRKEQNTLTDMCSWWEAWR